MRKQTSNLLNFIFFILIISGGTLKAQDNSINNSVVSFKKRELMSGFVFDVSKEREELLTDETKFDEDRTLLNAKFRFENQFWNLLDYKQEQINYAFEIGPFGGYGDWVDSSYIGNTVADHSFFGMRASANIDYSNRQYYDVKNYTLLEVGAWGRYDVYQQNSKGTSTDSMGVVTDFDNSDFENRFRYGFQAKAGWGVGRLSPMNHLMTAHYLLEKYYPGRIFSDYEIAQFAQVIANIKHNRDIKTEHVAEKEMQLVTDFIRNTLMLASPEAMAAEWMYSEFDPRMEGSRFEMGPFFKYYNQEPDFVYGGFVQYENAKYKNVSWNRNISVSLNYNRYKKQDWMLAEVNVGWSYYSKLKNQFDFGVRYVPAIEINGFEDVGSLSHNFVPYLSYFSQLNPKSRVRMDFSWRFADTDQFVLPGPEFSLAIYRSKY
ncbi:hypothetical protein OU798_15060 [Prolixibacteraceae bacterium Z1-6]|uniref:Uncharacterized protein n=1 Tax=Draconibacterium aestuarii TaxID=2998507 RepID=A0A9X3FFB5_9BACT|nr:hypothetical protein [Prolixibacteraceae bacterium Z1-6]